MKTAKYIKGQLKAIFDKANLDPELEAPLGAIGKAVDEWETQLKVTGEAWDSDADEFEYKAKAEPVPQGDWEQKYNDLSSKYDTLKTRYSDAFFNGDASAGNVDDSTNGAEIMADQNADIHEDGEVKTIDDLLVEM